MKLLIGLLFFLLLFLMTIPAWFFNWSGLHKYHFEEFGAMPKGVVDWLLITLFWLVVGGAAVAVVRIVLRAIKNP